jgi:hypothetical protein
MKSRTQASSPSWSGLQDKMIFYSIPYDPGRNIAQAYNCFMRVLPDERDFGCFVDGDACFTISKFGHQLEGIVAAHPQGRLFYATCNRVGCHWQRVEGAPAGNDIAIHRTFGQVLADKHGHEVREVQGRSPASGFLILVRKDLWQAVGEFQGQGMLGVDWAFFTTVAKRGEPIYQMMGVYLYHWYRGGTGDRSHLT